MKAFVEWPSEHSASIPGFSGRIDMEQKTAHSPTRFHVYLKGLPKTKASLKNKKNCKHPFSLFGFHVHTNPITKIQDLKKTCKECGGHFNPTNVAHGSKLVCDHYLKRHVGDLINNIYMKHKGNPNGEVSFTFTDKLARLIPTKKHNYSIIGKSIVVHEDIDDLGLQGRPKYLEDMFYYKPTSKGNLIKKTPQDPYIYPYPEKNTQKDSLANGNAGARIACGNINFVDNSDEVYYQNTIKKIQTKQTKK